MKIFSLTFLVSFVALAYLCHTTYVMYTLWNPEPCRSEKQKNCILPYRPKNANWTLKVYCTNQEKKSTFKSSDMIWKVNNIDFGQYYTKSIVIKLPSRIKPKQNLHLHMILHENGKLQTGKFSVSKSVSLTTYAEPIKYFKLVSDEAKPESKSNSEKVLHWRCKIFINVMDPPFTFNRFNFPTEVMKHVSQVHDMKYPPILFIDELSLLKSDLKEIKSDMTNITVEMSYAPISIGKLRLWTQLLASMESMKELGFTEEDTEQIRGIFTDTNIWFLALTFFVSTFHILFDILAFKHDVVFWMNRKTMEGLSFNTVVYRCISTIVIFFYLMDEQTSYLVLVPAGVGSIIEIWKVSRALKVTIVRNGWRFQIHFGSHTQSEKATEDYDQQAIKYLSYVLYPLIIVGATYSLFYLPQKSWYSWLIHSMANGVYAFGFLFMLPQLFINYKLKSVAHLPWKAFTYKAFNTFIDDVFAFIIKMPTSHRIACFRDDVVFFCYLYQRWLYPVDKTRVNEFGMSFEEDKKEK